MNAIGYIFIVAVLLGQCVLHTVSASSSRSDWSQHDNFIAFDLAPDKVVDGSVVRVLYRCSGSCQLAVEVVASTPGKTDSVIFQRTWISVTPRETRAHRVLLKFPPSILYQRSFFNRRVLEAQNATVRAWLDYVYNGGSRGTYNGSVARVSKVLEIVPLSERPIKPPTECPSWCAQLMWRMSESRIHQCPHESDVLDILKFPLASTGERFGLVRRFQPFINPALERARLHAVTRPSVTLSMWIYVLKWCRKRLCGIIHHVNRNNSYDSLLMQLSDTGDVIIQARVTTGRDEAFQANVALPLQKWIRLDTYIQNSKVVLDAKWDNHTRRFVYKFRDHIHYDDTDGYFVIGGSKYLPGIRGYFGPIKYYRFGTEEANNQLHHNSTPRELDKAHRECEETKAFTAALLQEVSNSHLVSPINKGACHAQSIGVWGSGAGKTCRQAWTWETQFKNEVLLHFVQEKAEDLSAGSLDIQALRSTLFEHATISMFSADEEQINVTSELISLLQVSSCLGNHQASLLLAAIHLSGLGLPVNQQQGHVYSLIGALGDSRFALMHAGYKHALGIDGFPKDLGMAYNYYSNAGVQNIIDNAKTDESKQYTPEHIYLSSHEDLSSLTHDKSDVFQYLELQAARGDVESQKRLGAMLYWGQHGVSKDTASGVKWLERCAMQMKDPSVMYHYSILLMKGQGVKRNYSRGFRLLEKAAAMGSISAVNGLGWYHGTVLKDHKTAVKFFKQAALNGSADGMFNLGIYHLMGQIPESPRRNETAAFRHFLNASEHGHITAAVEAAWYLSTGSLEGVSQDEEGAVILLKRACEQNGHLGFMIREALQAYLQGSRREAFIKYVLAAETGLGLAQSNAAHLCEELNLGGDCQWRYHNHSILDYDPHPSALLKMGDYYYDSSRTRGGSLSVLGQAISMYSRAARAGSPEGMFNLAVLAQQGHALPPSIYRWLHVSSGDGRGAVLESILKRCVETEDEEAVTPCSLALLGVQMGKALRKMSQSGAQLLLAYASLLSVTVITVIVLLQSCLGPPDSRAVAPRARTSSVSQDGVNMNRVGGGITGGTLGARGNPRLTALNGERWLRQSGDLAVTVSGVCLCALWTTLLYHLL